MKLQQSVLTYSPKREPVRLYNQVSRLTNESLRERARESCQARAEGFIAGRCEVGAELLDYARSIEWRPAINGLVRRKMKVRISLKALSRGNTTYASNLDESLRFDREVGRQVEAPLVARSVEE